MMLEKLKESISASPKKFALLVTLVLAIIAVGVYQVKDAISGIIPNESAIAAERKRLVAAQRKLKAALNKNNSLIAHRAELKKAGNDFWLEERDGDISMAPQKILNGAAEASNVSLSSMGAIRIDSLSDGVSVGGLYVKCAAPLGDMVRFLAEIDKARPRMQWKQLSFYSSNSKSTNTIVLGGTIQFIVVKDKKAQALILGEKDAENEK
jgi:hypothetical protein